MYRNIQTDKVRVAIVGLGNCASSLIQGIHYYANRSAENCIGVLHHHVGPYGIADIGIVAAFDIDSRKVGKDVNEAIFEAPNCTKIFAGDLPVSGVAVRMGRVLDGVAEHMTSQSPERTFLPADLPEPEATSRSN